MNCIVCDAKVSKKNYIASDLSKKSTCFGKKALGKAMALELAGLGYNLAPVGRDALDVCQVPCGGFAHIDENGYLCLPMKKF